MFTRGPVTSMYNKMTSYRSADGHWTVMIYKTAASNCQLDACQYARMNQLTDVMQAFPWF